MPGFRRILRRIEPSRMAAFDERAWPVNVALLVLAVLAAGLIVVAGAWDDPRLLHNGWVKLMTLAVTLGGLAWAANTISPRRARRLQFAVLVSLIAHIVLAVVLHHQHLRLFVEKPVETEPSVVKTPVPAPVVAPPETAKAEFERPVETELIEVVKNAPIEPRTETDPEEAPYHEIPVPELPKVAPPAEVAEREPEVARPRRAENLAKWNRRPTAPASASGGAAAPKRVARNDQPSKEPGAAKAKLARHAPRQPAAPVPTVAASRQSSTEPHGATRRTELQQPTASTAARQIAKRDANQRKPTVATQLTEVAAVRPIQLEETHQPSSQSQVALRSEAASPRIAVRTPDLLASTLADASEGEQPRRNRREARPTVARSDDPSRAQRFVEIAPSVDTTAASERPSSQSTDRSATTLASQATGTQRAVLQPSPWREAETNTETISETLQVSIGQPSPRRARRAAEPSIAPLVRSRDAPRRALEQAEALTSPVVATSSLAAQNSSTSRAGPAPNALALTRASDGFIGGSRGSNAGRDLPVSNEHLAPFPSTAARRAIATQQQPGPALSPTINSRLAKATAGADAPTAPAMAKPLEMAEMAGSQRPGRLAASASAAIKRQFAAAAPGEITASVGSGDLDTGAEQIVPASGSGRLAGGGQPRIQLAAATPTRRSATGGGAPGTALAADVFAQSPASPQAQGGGAPATASRLAASDTSGAGRSAAAAILAKPSEGGSAVAATFGPQSTMSIRRDELSEADPGMAGGGGTSSPRSMRGPATPALARAAMPSSFAAPWPGGAEQGPVLVATSNAQGDVSSTGGLPHQAATVGLISASSSTEGEAAVAMPAGPSPLERGSTETTSPTRETTGRAPSHVALAAALPSASATGVSSSPPIAAKSDAIQASISDTVGSGDLALWRHGSGAIIDIAIEGIEASGLGPTISISAGLPDRLAQPRSPVLQTTPSRFVRKRTIGQPTIRGMARKPAPAFAKRAHRGNPSDAASLQQPSEKTEEAIELGLKFLAKRQLSDGRWSLARNGVDLILAPRERPRLESDAAATGLSLLAFLGAGYDHFDDKHQDAVSAGLNFLVKNQQANGSLYIPGDEASGKYSRFYSHGIATIAVCEAFGMTGDPALRKPAQKAIDFIVQTQHKKYGGWRYRPGRDSDLSVTGWQVMALKSGELAGLNVPMEVYLNAQKFLERCRGSGGDASRFVYNPYVDVQDATRRHGRETSTVMTSVGLLTNLYLGKNRDDQNMQHGAKHLLNNPPTHGTSSRAAAIGTMGNPLRDTYYWYYATQVMFHMRGDYWKEWNARLHPLLVESQTQVGPLAGSWNPFNPVPDQWVAHGGRLYVTTMNLLSLEVYYRHLPLFEATGQ